MSSSEGPNCGVNVGIDSKDRVNPGRIRARHFYDRKVHFYDWRVYSEDCYKFYTRARWEHDEARAGAIGCPDIRPNDVSMQIRHERGGGPRECAPRIWLRGPDTSGQPIAGASAEE